MSGVNALIDLKISAKLAGAADLGTPVAPVSVSKRIQIAPGTDLDEADILWADERTIAASGNEDLDLAGVLSGPLGGTTPTLTLGPGDCALITNRKGWAVSAGDGDLLNVANSAGSTGVTYTIVLIGRTVADS
ncbi:MAG: hypothetical protein GC201_01005 [Alphaproteobacteria bacterium]|nr:hypothetical protein [Alphaproteobacteria bacterium]